MPMEPMIFVYGSGQHDHNEQMEPDLLLLDSELFALLTHFLTIFGAGKSVT